MRSHFALEKVIFIFLNFSGYCKPSSRDSWP